MSVSDWSRYNRARREAKRARGECRDCSNPSGGRVRCDVCAAKNRRPLRSQRDHAQANGLCQRCGSPAAVANGETLSRCLGCLSRSAPSAVGYEPLDRILGRVSVRILRALCRFDTATSADLIDALDVGANRTAFGRRLGELHSDGFVRKSDNLYSISETGRIWLSRQLARADVGEYTEADEEPDPDECLADVGVASDEELKEEAA